MRTLGQLLFLLVVAAFSQAAVADEPAPLKLLFLGDDGHHRPAERFAQLQPRMQPRGIELVYTDRLEDLNREVLDGYDGLIIYANQEVISPDQERALLEYVESGGGFVPLHCASYCFLNSPAYIALVGAQFQRHGGQVFGTEIANPEHPVIRGFGGFRSWDETYIHSMLTDDRTVLEYRVEGEQAKGRDREPFTWVRTQGEGRVFYTAWGHDERTWSNPGFINLVERGIRWACKQDPTVAGAYAERQPFVMPDMTELRSDVEPFEYEEVGNKIPNYVAGERWGEQGEPLTKMQRPLSPEESLKHYVTPVGFHAELYAAEPELGAKPIAMAWDDRGRLWVSQTIDYPNELRQPGEGNDRITICEDTTGDGRADQFTVFAERLSIPTAIVHYRGGVIVQDGAQTLFLKDTDGDDQADVRKVLITGWGMNDTHGGVSNFRYGLDNWIWAMQGYNDSRPEFAGGQSQRFRMGFFRFKLDGNDPPEVVDLEFIRSTDNNTWGLGISEEGLIFGSTANRNPSVFMPIANRYYEQVRGWGPTQLRSIADTHLFEPITDKVRQVDQHGGYTAGAGHAIYTARTYPKQWWNRTAFVNGPTGHLTGVFVLEPSGAGFTSHSPGNLIASDDEWAAPIVAEVGPDGNVWVIDWYNYIIQHNPTPQGFETGRGAAYETDLRDKTHGRILRVAHATEPPAPPSLAIDDTEALVAALGHSNMLWRLHAQRLLIERGQADVVPALCELVRDTSVDAIGLNPAAIHALWTLHGLGAIESFSGEVGEALAAALEHPSAGVRRNALQVLPNAPESTLAVLRGGLADDSDPQVRLAAILALADLPGVAGIGEALSTLAADPMIMGDRWLSDAVTSAAAAHADDFLLAYAQTDGSVAEPTARVVERVAEHVARGRQVDALDQVLRLTAEARTDRVAPVLRGLSNGWPRGYQQSISPETEAALLQLAGRLPAPELSQLIALAESLGTDAFEAYAEQVAASLRERLEDDSLDDQQRLAAASQLVELRPEDSDAVEAVLATIGLQTPPETAAQLIGTLEASRSAELGGLLVERLAEWTPAIREPAIRLLLSRPEWTTSLLDALEAGDANLSDLPLDQRQALAAHPNEEIRQRATAVMERGGGLPSPDRVAVIERYMAAAEHQGNADRGRALYTEHCSKCHRHGSLGQEVGPDLTGMAVHPKEELLVHILDPSRSVEGNFRAYMVLTVEGRVLTGMLAGESKTTVELIDTNAKRETVSRSDIEELTASSKSVMPEGFEDQLDVAAMTDLLEFLTTRGRYLPLDLRPATTVSTARPMFYGSPGEVFGFDEWGPKEFNGVPFVVLNPLEGRVANAIMLHGPQGSVPPTLPPRVELPVGAAASAVHLLGGIGGWNAKQPIENGPPVMTVRVHYADGQTEDHVLRDGVHFADYIGPFDVPGSEPAFRMQGRQVRYLKLEMGRKDQPIEKLEFIKARLASAPITLAVTIESP